MTDDELGRIDPSVLTCVDNLWRRIDELEVEKAAMQAEVDHLRAVNGELRERNRTGNG